jgi:lipopolysaccharide biosynthesis protein
MTSFLESPRPRLADPLCLAFFLPQFHPIPENDQWWGEGFTEWQNVAKARPRFRGHYQPHLPADLGFYDLRVPEVREAQAGMAREAGLDGFVYYHYWFNGKRLLQRPVDEILASRRPDFPFCLAWANENWTRKWDGGDDEILIGQRYSLKDDLDHIQSLRPALLDDRYVRVDGKPVLLIYRSSKLPDPKGTTDLWRNEAERWGLPGLYLLRVESFSTELADPVGLGFDAAVQFQPAAPYLPPQILSHRVRRRIGNRFDDGVYSYERLVSNALTAERPSYPRWPGVSPGFDNSARRSQGATIFVGSTPQKYEKWLSGALEESEKVARAFHQDRGLVFINAWNEWAEGNHLEPGDKYGSEYLAATRSAIQGHKSAAVLSPDPMVHSGV